MAESHRDEIAKLEALFSAHPDGRVFTHLAEAYRKSGDLGRAREILEHGLSRHAEYASAHVVFGRVLWDEGKLDEAAGAFGRVLELDRQNLVALRALADLARQAGRTEQALGYYRELGALDPGNEEVEAVIRELEASAPAADAAAPEGLDGGDRLDAGIELTAGSDFLTEPAPDAPIEAPIDVTQRAEPEGEFGDALGGDLVEALGGDPAEAVESAFDPAADAGLEPTAIVEEGPAIVEEGPAIREEGPAAVGDGPMMAEDGPMLVEEDPMLVEEGPAAVGDGSTTPAEGPTGVGGAGPAVSGFEGGVEGGVAPEATAGGEDVEGGSVVTETMADLYARQGLYDRAAEVYRELLRRRPEDGRLAAKLAEVEGAGGGGPGAAGGAAPEGVGDLAIEGAGGAGIEAVGDPGMYGAGGAGMEGLPELDLAPDWELQVPGEPGSAASPPEAEPAAEPDVASAPSEASAAIPGTPAAIPGTPAATPEASAGISEASAGASAAPVSAPLEAPGAASDGPAGGSDAPAGPSDVPGGVAVASADAAAPGDVVDEPTIGEYFRALLSWTPSRRVPESTTGIAAGPEAPAAEQAEAGPHGGAEAAGVDDFDQLFGVDERSAELVTDAGPAAWDTGAPDAWEAEVGPLAPADPAAEAPQEADGPAPAEELGGPAAGEGEDDDDDLEMFRAWLQNLKR